MQLVKKLSEIMNKYEFRFTKADKTSYNRQILKMRFLYLWQTMEKENSALATPTVQLTSALHVQEPRR